MLRVVVAHRKQGSQELLLAFRRKVRTHREAAVVEWLRGGQDGVLAWVDGAVLRPSLPVQIHQGTGVGLISSETLKGLQFTADVVAVLADHEIKAPHLHISAKLQPMALQQPKRDERGLG